MAFLVALYSAILAAAWVLTPETLAWTIAIAIVAVIATALILQVEGTSRIRRLQEGDPHARETHFVELSAAGIRSWCAHVDARYPWSDFTKVFETPEFYLFVRPGGLGAAIPKRLLDPARAAELRARIREWAPHRGAALGREAA